MCEKTVRPWKRQKFDIDIDKSGITAGIQNTVIYTPITTTRFIRFFFFFFFCFFSMPLELLEAGRLPASC